MYCECGSYDFHYIDASGAMVHFDRICAKHMIFIPKGLGHGVQRVEYPYYRYFLDLPVNLTTALLDGSALLSPFQTQTINAAGGKEWAPSRLDAAKSAAMVESIFERMLNLRTMSDVDNSFIELHMNCLLGLLFCELYRSHPDFFTTKSTPHDKMVSEARRYIDEHYDQPLAISDLAKRLYVHPSHLSHCFAAQTGISPRKYLTSLRLANARKLLESSDDSVQTIALKVGFSDVNNFIQSFKERYGSTPKKYRTTAASELLTMRGV
jgi:AraC-like DNA-binding protein